MTGMTKARPAGHWMDDPSPITASFAVLYRRVQVAYMEAQARATTSEQQHHWQLRSAALVGFLDTLDPADAQLMLDAVALLKEEHTEMIAVIATQVAAGMVRTRS